MKNLLFLSTFFIGFVCFGQDTLTKRNGEKMNIHFYALSKKTIQYKISADTSIKELKNKYANTLKLEDGNICYFNMRDKYKKINFGVEVGYGFCPFTAKSNYDDLYTNVKKSMGFTLFATKRIYKFIDLQARIANLYSLEVGDNYWRKSDYCVGVNFNINLSNKLFIEAPILLNYSSMTISNYITYSIENNINSFGADCSGVGFYGGISLNRELFKGFSAGLSIYNSTVTYDMHYPYYDATYYQTIGNGFDVHTISIFTSSIRLVKHF